MATITANEMKVGNLLRYDGSVYRVVSTSHVKPGKGGAFIQAELKEVLNGGTKKVNERFRSDETLDRANFESIKCQFLYRNGDVLEFMNLENFEQFSQPLRLLRGPVELLQENSEMVLDLVDKDVIAINLPAKVKVEIKETQAILKKATKTSSFKPALTTNGLTVYVPDFIEGGDEVIISTETLEYVERAKK